MENNEYGKLLKETWETILIILIAFAVMVFTIFTLSDHAHKKELKRLEWEKAQKEFERLLSLEDVSIYAFVNDWGGSKEERSIKKLSAGTEYRVGTLHQYDRMAIMGKGNYNKTYPINDNYIFNDPIITFYCKKRLLVQYSLNKEGSYLYYGETDRNSKTLVPYYTIKDKYYGDNASVYINPGQMMTVTFPVNGDGGIEAQLNDLSISENMRQFNYYVDQKLSEVSSNVPEKYADRSRRIWTSYLFVTVFNDKGAAEFKFKILIKKYGGWNLTMQEFAELAVYVPGLTQLGGELDYYRGTVIEIIP